MSNINSSGNMTPEQLMKLAASFGGKDATDPEKAINAVSKQLSDEKRQKLNEVLSDKSALEKLLQSPEAQRLMKKFGVDNIGDILSSLSDEDMKALGDAARSLLGSSEQEQGQNDSDRGFSMDPATMAKIAQIMSAMNRHDSRCDLIAALRPLLSEPRRRRADDAMQLIKLIALLPMIEDLGRK